MEVEVEPGAVLELQATLGPVALTCHNHVGRGETADFKVRAELVGIPNLPVDTFKTFTFSGFVVRLNFTVNAVNFRPSERFGFIHGAYPIIAITVVNSYFVVDARIFILYYARMNIVSIFELLSHRWHVDICKQKRKYTGADYDTHTRAVAKIYADYFPIDEIGIAACHGHDLLEDCEKFGLNRVVLLGEIQELKPDKPQLVPLVLSIIVDVTHIYTHEAYPNKSRAERKLLEAERLSRVITASQNLKACDLIHNTGDIVPYDPGFARKYVREQRHLLSVMTKVDTRLRTAAEKILRDNYRVLGLTWNEEPA